MGQAKRRGTFDERKAVAIAKATAKESEVKAWRDENRALASKFREQQGRK